MQPSGVKKPIKGWNQEVTDEQGRRRFHGAFTGGFSAGFYNTVGSKEGWQPSSFQSSRSKRSEFSKQKPEDFMDEDDDPLLGKDLVTNAKFDTMDQHGMQRAREQASRATSSAIPGPIPDDFILPAANSIGKKLLMLLGWKEGQGIGPKIRKKKENGEEFFVAPKNTLRVDDFPKPKLDTCGIGFDPYLDAPEFARYRQSRENPTEQRRIVAFADALNASGGETKSALHLGTGALEDDDDFQVYNTEELYDTVAGPAMKRIGYQQQVEVIQSSTRCSDGRRPVKGFVMAMIQRPVEKVIRNPVVPPSFDPRHKQSTTVAPSLYTRHSYAGLSSVQRGVLLGEKTRVKPKTPDPALSKEFKAGMSAAIGNRFTSGGSDPAKSRSIQVPTKPVRSESLWRPDKLLCKRFNVPAPITTAEDESDAIAERRDRYTKEIQEKLPEAVKRMEKVVVEPVELPDLPPILRPPVDLFKAIFEASSDEEEEDEEEDEAEADGGEILSNAIEEKVVEEKDDEKILKKKKSKKEKIKRKRSKSPKRKRSKRRR